MDNQNNIIIYNTPDGEASVALYAKDGSVWMNQNQLAELFDTSVPNISMHISNILKEGELEENSVIKNYLTTAADGKEYKVTFYSLEMILAIGFRVRSKCGTQFRIWANRNLREYMVKGFVIDDERLKNPDGCPDYFDELLERIRDIRASEKRFYQKVCDLFALSSDYDPSDKATQMFFAETQNKLIFAVTGKTAAEIIVSRADTHKPNMAYFSKKSSLKEMIGHIYGQNNLMERNDRPDLFVKELSLNLDYYIKETETSTVGNERAENQNKKIHAALEKGIEYYRQLFSLHHQQLKISLNDSLNQLDKLENRLNVGSFV
ncbi:MAG: 2-hydroxyacid dehydrogenase [Anaerophaga sp.]|nr:2-hydroxyacid dehydrogenase [Anaerophaga sp.]